MRAVVRTVSWVLRFAAPGAEGASWFTPTPELGADDVDDRIGAGDTERLLSDDQFATLGECRDSTLADRWVLRNALAAVAPLVIPATSCVLATRSAPRWTTP